MISGIKDKTAMAQINNRVRRLALSQHGDCKRVGKGVFELRIHYSPGFRVYFSEHGKDLVILLLGGDKGSQKRDIKQAINYWQDYKRDIMKKINTNKVNKMTGDYDEWLNEHLQDKKAACEHIQVALDTYQLDQDKEALLLALKDVAQAQGGIGWLSKETDLNREHLYYLLSGKGNPRLDTLSQIFRAFGMHLSISVIKKSRA